MAWEPYKGVKTQRRLLDTAVHCEEATKLYEKAHEIKSYFNKVCTEFFWLQLLIFKEDVTPLGGGRVSFAREFHPLLGNRRSE
jgi:hypothetical protein